MLKQLKRNLVFLIGLKYYVVPRRLTEKNGVIYPTLALPKVLEKHPNTLLIYAGTGEQHTNIEQTVTKLNLHTQVKLLGLFHMRR